VMWGAPAAAAALPKLTGPFADKNGKFSFCLQVFNFFLY